MKYARFTLTLAVDDELLADASLQTTAEEILWTAPAFDHADDLKRELRYVGEVESRDAPACPACGSGDVTAYREADEYTCNACGHSWAGYE